MIRDVVSEEGIKIGVGTISREIGNFIGVYGVVIGRCKTEGGRGVRRGRIVEIILVVVDRLIWAPFNDEAGVLEEGRAITALVMGSSVQEWRKSRLPVARDIK